MHVCPFARLRAVPWHLAGASAGPQRGARPQKRKQRGGGAGNKQYSGGDNKRQRSGGWGKDSNYKGWSAYGSKY